MLTRKKNDNSGTAITPYLPPKKKRFEETYKSKQVLLNAMDKIWFRFL